LLSFLVDANDKRAQENFKIDTGCSIDLVISRELANSLELPISGTKRVRVPSGQVEMEFCTAPISISFVTGRGSTRTFTTTKTVIGERSLLGKPALEYLRITLPKGASEGVVYIFEVEEDTIG